MTRRLTLIGCCVVAIGITAAACLSAATIQSPQATSACSSAEPSAPAPAPPLPPQEPPVYVVGRSDVLKIMVQPDMSPADSGKCSRDDYNVGADGKINFCMLGAIKVEGLTERGIEGMIRKAFQEQQIYMNPNVTAEVTKFRSQSIYVQGQVRTPGEIALQGNEMTLMHAISSAGGFVPEAGPDIFILRPRRSPAAGSAPINLEDPLAEKTKYSRKALNANLEDPPLQNGDTVFVSQAEMFFINGQVKQPGSKVWEPCITVGEAIAMAGGMTEKGSLGRSYIQRKNAKGTFDRIKHLKNETLLQAKDELVIGRSLF